MDRPILLDFYRLHPARLTKDPRTYTMVSRSHSREHSTIRLPVCLTMDRITHEVEGINRVLMDLTPKPVGTIEWE